MCGRMSKWCGSRVATADDWNPARQRVDDLVRLGDPGAAVDRLQLVRPAGGVRHAARGQRTEHELLARLGLLDPARPGPGQEPPPVAAPEAGAGRGARSRRPASGPSGSRGSTAHPGLMLTRERGWSAEQFADRLVDALERLILADA